MRLSPATLDLLPADVARPGYDRAAVMRGVVHLGIGAFHRAHQAVVFDRALAAGDLRWGVTGVSLRSAETRDRLAAQDGLYTLLIRDGDAVTAQVIGAVREVLVAPEDPAAVVAALADPAVHLVTLTITEKGYRLDRGRLRMDDADVAADLADLSAPRTAIGLIVAGLAARRCAGVAPFTALSCDNLPHNGAVLRSAVLAMAAAHNPALHDWIAASGAFPATMVDRIVPATTPVDIAALAGRSGVEDRAMVKTEPFLQWVVEDWFCGLRPDLAALGVQLTDAVAPWEDAKLRLLNGAHSGIAYLGGLAGIDFVHQFVAREEGWAFVDALWDESAATLDAPRGLDIPGYCAALMARFGNAALEHRTDQIAQDGSQKLPQRLIAPIMARRAAGLPVDMLTLAVAAWMRWQDGRDDAGRAFAIEDPMAATTAAALAGKTRAADRVDALLAIDAIFPPDLAADCAVRDRLVEWVERLQDQGALGVLAGLAH
ncbi:mannitol dehydrogenase family protein (plasmid) [Sphingomonas sp. NY01]|uniref:mannitol dehydrogenase family protein n=1 Tax=Sphingomonas sp. NY01 TaxID=2968057 RepID=UPI00315D777C